MRLTRRAIESRDEGPPTVTRSNVLTLEDKKDKELDPKQPQAGADALSPMVGPAQNTKAGKSLAPAFKEQTV